MLQEVQVMREELNWLKAEAVPGVSVPVALVTDVSHVGPKPVATTTPSVSVVRRRAATTGTHGRGACRRADEPDQRG